MRHLTWCQAALLATLLDSDGAPVPYAALGDAVGSKGINDRAVIKQHVTRLRAKGVACVEMVPSFGYRMTTLPPDWTLEIVVAVLDSMRRDMVLAPVELGRTA